MSECLAQWHQVTIAAALRRTLAELLLRYQVEFGPVTQAGAMSLKQNVSALAVEVSPHEQHPDRAFLPVHSSLPPEGELLDIRPWGDDVNAIAVDAVILYE